ncbi:MAG: ATP-binding protein [Sedimentisphaerales bacterium]|nr:ATP-binding protein [Sedimentisphaerales bacterium]
MRTTDKFFPANDDHSPRLIHEVLVEQLKWLIRLRWLASLGIVSAGIICTYIFPVLENAVPFYVCGVLLSIFNLIYVRLLTNRTRTKVMDIALAMVQIEADLLILTILLHFSGGITNPFMLFYVFHIILATIVLPRTLSFSVGISTIVMFGVMMVGELQNWRWLEHKPLLFSSISSLWSNPVYAFGTFVAFVAMIVLTQYLTRTVIARMTAKEVEAARNHDVIQAIINAMTEGLLFITRQGNLAICNPAAQGWAEYPWIVNDEDPLSHFPAILTGHIQDLLKSDGSAIVGKTIKLYLGKPQNRYVEAKSCPVVSNDGVRLGYVIVGQDLTEHKKLERNLLEHAEEIIEINEMLKRSRIELTQREKMVAIGQMATGIAHEIGNPLASLSSVVQYLRRKPASAEQDQHLAVIGTQVERISTILKRMLNLSRPVTSEYKWTDINTVIDSTLSLIKFDKRAQSVRVDHSPNDKLPMVWLNPQLLEQVFLNIFINALDAMVAKKNDEQHVLTVISEYKDEMIEVRTTDTGIGMSPEVCKRAFESFFTTKEIGKGTGLGLFITYNLITEIDGTIDMVSESGKGTTIIIRMPVRPKKHLIGEESQNSGLLK